VSGGLLSWISRLVTFTWVVTPSAELTLASSQDYWGSEERWRYGTASEHPHTGARSRAAERHQRLVESLGQAKAVADLQGSSQYAVARQ
jgi:hypothetical protein